MIEASIKKILVDIRDTKTKRVLRVEVGPDKVALYNEHAELDFAFSTANTKETRERWYNVLELIGRGIREAEILTDELWPAQTITKGKVTAVKKAKKG